MNWANYIPLATSALSLVFFVLLFRRWRQSNARHVFWWMLGVFFYGAANFTQCVDLFIGFHPVNFKAWYIFGALLGGAPLAQGVAYLMLKKRTADGLSTLLIPVLVITAILVICSPVNTPPQPYTGMSGKLLAWSFIRMITPFVNTYACVFLVGGAIYSAILYSRDMASGGRVTGNIFIAIGSLLPSIGSSFSRFGFIEVLYITSFVGICLIYGGYEFIRSADEKSMYPTQII